MTQSWRAMRNRWLAKPGVRSWLAALPFGRVISDAHARRLFGLVSGFAQTQLLLAALELGVLQRLLACDATTEDLLADCKLGERGGQRLVEAVIALGLVERRGDKLTLSIAGVVAASDSAIAAIMHHNKALYADLQDPGAFVARGGGSGHVAAIWPYEGAGEPRRHMDVMAATQSFFQSAVLGSYDFGRHRNLLDVGGGDGGFALALSRRFPKVRTSVAELPAAAEIARTRLDGAGESQAIVVHAIGAGEPLPPGYDAITLVRLLHDLDDTAAHRLLVRVREALVAGGRVIVVEPAAVADRRDEQTAYFAAYFLALGSGRLRTQREIRSLMTAAGLKPLHRQPRAATFAKVIVAECKY